MTGQDIQERLDAIVGDLQTLGKGQTVNIMFRDTGNAPLVLPLSSDANGVVSLVQLQAINAFLSDVIAKADDYAANYAPVQIALETFKTAQQPHQALMDASSAARKNLSDVLESDQVYQTAKNALDAARENAAYVAAKNGYGEFHVSENYAELQAAKGKYQN